MTPPIGRDTAWTAAGFGTQLVGQLARAVLLTRVLSPDDLGRFFVLRSFVGVAAIVAQGGFGAVGLKRVAGSAGDRPAQRDTVAGVVRLTAIVAAAVATLAAALTWVAGFGLPAAGGLGVMVAAFALAPVMADLCRGLGRLRAAVMIERGFGVMIEVMALAGAVLLLGSLDLVDVLLLLAAASVAPVVLLGWQLGGATRGIRSSGRGHSDRVLLADSWPVTVNGLLWRGLGEADLWLVGGTLGAAAAGVYGLAIRLAAPLRAVVGIAGYRLAEPVAALYASGSRGDLQRLLQRAARGMTVLAVTGWLAIAALGSSGVAAIFGQDYAGAFPLFLVLGFGQVVSAVAGVGGTTLLMIGRQRTLMWISLGSSVVTVAAAVLLIPRLGPIGAAWASATGITVQNVLMVRAVRRYADVRIDAFQSHA